MAVALVVVVVAPRECALTTKYLSLTSDTTNIGKRTNLKIRITGFGSDFKGVHAPRLYVRDLPRNQSAARV